MRFSRIIDEKTLQYQRQGRMLTYAPNLGQEATQVGSAFAIRQTDWVAPSFRELGVWLRKGAPLKNIFLYWFGNELGMKMPEEVRILPVTIPIASQMQHASGLAYAARYRGLDDIAVAYVGDGGTSQETSTKHLTLLRFRAYLTCLSYKITSSRFRHDEKSRRNQARSHRKHWHMVFLAFRWMVMIFSPCTR
jgi:TPP-dependent pyruvate/acetoin dehydrogenase alpha subunit